MSRVFRFIFRPVGLLFFVLVVIFLWEIGIFSPHLSVNEASGISKIATPVPYYGRALMEEGQTDTHSKEFPEIFWLGHNGFYIEWAGRKILFDPNLSEYCKIVPRRSISSVTPEFFGEVDVVLISHAHYDHLDLPTLSRLKKIRNLVLPAEISSYLGSEFTRSTHTYELTEGARLDLDGIKITSVFSKHNGSRYHPFSSHNRATGYVLEYMNVKVYLAGDTGYGEFFKQINEQYHPDISILPIGAYEPYFILHEYHLSPEDAVRAAQDLSPSYIIPSHYGTFRLALDRIDQALPEFSKRADEAHLRWGVARPIKP